MRTHAVIWLIVIWLTGCEDHAMTTCQVTYEVDTTGSYGLARAWKLIGFQKNGSSDIAYPPCERRGSRKNKDITLVFSDTLHNLSKHIYPYPYLLTGQGPINDFGTSYKADEDGKLMVGNILSTLIGGNNELITYEKQYFSVISRAERFEITHNLLTLYDDQGDRLRFVALE